MRGYSLLTQARCRHCLHYTQGLLVAATAYASYYFCLADAPIFIHYKLYYYSAFYT